VAPHTQNRFRTPIMKKESPM